LRAHGLARELSPEAGRRAADREVVRRPARTEGVLQLDGDRRIGTLEARRTDDDEVDLRTGAPRRLERALRGKERELGLHRYRVFGAIEDARAHARGVEAARP